MTRFASFAQLRDELIATVPTPMALTLQRLRDAALRDHCLEVLWFLRDAVECALRLHVAVGVADLLAHTPRDVVSLRAFVEKYFSPLMGKPPSLGDWVNVMRSILHAPIDDSMCPALRRVRRSAMGRSSPWHRLFEGSSNFVSFRNRTLGHGAYTPEREFVDDLLMFQQPFVDFASAAASDLWSDAVICAPGVVWRGPTVEDAGDRSQTGWFSVQLQIDGQHALPLDPLVRAHRRAPNANADLVVYDRLRSTGWSSTRLKASFVDYLMGRHREDSAFAQLIVEFASFISFAEPGTIATDVRVQPDEATAELQRFQPVLYLEKQLATWAQHALSGQRGSYAMLIGDAGTGKTWFARSIQLWRQSGLGYTRNSILHSRRCLKIYYLLQRRRQRRLWQRPVAGPRCSGELHGAVHSVGLAHGCQPFAGGLGSGSHAGERAAIQGRGFVHNHRWA